MVISEGMRFFRMSKFFLWVDIEKLNMVTIPSYYNQIFYLVDIGYGEWTQWSPCTVTCGEMAKIRTRDCVEEICRGKSDDIRSCGLNPCPSNDVLIFIGSVKSTKNQLYFKTTAH